MIERVTIISIAVEDQDQALAFFTEKLGYEKKADMRVPGRRWLTVAPKGQKEVEFLLASWFPDFVGKNATCVVQTADCAATVAELKARGVEVTQDPVQRPYGTEAVFLDLYGNHYALLEPARMP